MGKQKVIHKIRAPLSATQPRRALTTRRRARHYRDRIPPRIRFVVEPANRRRRRLRLLLCLVTCLRHIIHIRQGQKTCNQLAARSTLHFLILPFGVFHSSVHLLHYHSFALFSPRHSSPSSVCLPFSPFSYFFPGCSFSFQLTFLHSMFGIPEFLFALCALVLALQQTTPAPIDAFLTR